MDRNIRNLIRQIARQPGSLEHKHLRHGRGGHVVNQIRYTAEYLFAGSQKHLLADMFVDAKRAFYKSASGYPLHPIATADYVAWIQKLYARDQRRIDPKHIETVVARCENHPMYIQEFFFHLWDAPEVSIERIEQVESTSRE